MPEFVPIETKFKMPDDSGGIVVIVITPDVDDPTTPMWDTVDVAPGDAQLIVDWMAKRTAENVAWIEAMDEVLLVMRMAAGLETGEGYSAISLINMATAALADAVPEDKPCDQNESEVDGE